MAAEMAGQAELIVWPLNDLPLFDDDLDTDTPPAPVARFREAIRDADGLMIATPEYNHGMSGVLKNALDWASRPPATAVLRGKPVLTLSASRATTGGVRAQAQVNETLAAVFARRVLRPQIVIGSAHEKVADGMLVDRTTIDFVLAGIRDLLDAIGHGQ